MANSLRFKRSPIVVIRTLVGIEVLAFICYSLAAALGNYKYELYSQLFLAHLISYQTLKFLVLSSVQLVITIYAFLAWYYEEYTLTPEAITHSRGLFFKQKKMVPLKKTMSVTLSAGPLGKWLHYGSIYIQNSGSGNGLVLSDISYPGKYQKLMAKLIHNQSDQTDPAASPAENAAPSAVPPEINQLLTQPEHEKLEFKSSLRFDHHSHQANRELEKAAMKTLAAFLNSRGGQLIIGVSNSRELLGLAPDYQTLPRPNSDSFENHFTQVFNQMIGPEFRHLVRLWFKPINGRDICVIAASPAARPVYLKQNGSEHFYVRTGNGTTPLKLSEVEAYTAARWPRRNYKFV